MSSNNQKGKRLADSHVKKHYRPVSRLQEMPLQRNREAEASQREAEAVMPGSQVYNSQFLSDVNQAMIGYKV